MATLMPFDEAVRDHYNEQVKLNLARLHRHAQEDRLLMLDKPWTWRSLLDITDSVLRQLRHQTTQTEAPEFSEGTRSDE